MGSRSVTLNRERSTSRLKGLRFQASSKLIAEVIGRLLQFAFIYAAQRILGPANYGIVTLGLAVGVVLAVALLTVASVVGASPGTSETRLVWL